MADPALRRPALRGPVPFLVVLAAIGWLFAAMPVWRSASAPAGEVYAITPEAFEARVAAEVKSFATGESARFAGEDEEAIPVVHPPPGDVHVLARRWQFWPYLELEEGKTYRLHVGSADILHGFALAGADLLLAPGQAQVVTVTPRAGQPLVMQCSEFCGVRHNRMKASIRVVPAR
jgi:cytochrome c oxidase subunit 2